MELLSEEQESLGRAVRDWLADRTDLDDARAQRAGRADRLRADDLQAAAGLGLPGLLRAADGGTFTDLAVVVEELGRAGSALPLGQAAIAARVLDETGLDGTLAGGIAAGSTLCVPVAAEPDEAPVVGVAGADGTLVLDGRASAVIGGAVAPWLLVTAVVEGLGPAVALVAAEAAGVSRRARITLDLTRDIAAIECQAAAVPPARWTRPSPDTAGILAAAPAMLVALDAAGAAARLLDMTVGYVKQRSQFGRVIGSFQAVKHACATMALDVEAARVCAVDVAHALDGGSQAAVEAAAAVAGAVTGEACSRVASTALQLHGGMGFTWEHDLHLYLRRIKVDELLAGTPRYHRERMLRLAS